MPNPSEEETNMPKQDRHGLRAASAAGLIAIVSLIAGTAGAADGWTPASGGHATAEAVVGGWEANGERLFVCSAKFNGGIHAGKVRAQFGGCNIGWGGREHTVAQYWVLTGAGFSWWPTAGGHVPRHAVQGGNEQDGEPLYVCRAFFNGGIHAGKVRAQFGGCNIGWGGREHTVRDYEVLVR
ncbi:MAG: DUF3421 domain-containing protein [Rhizobiales bacterium]|nr:DUF3421 domain-containing protein [Hyphomicrobiales bacterium]